MKVKNNRLFVGEIPAGEIARKFGTPVYVYDEDVIRARYRELKSSISHPRAKIHYACKANSNPEIMRILKEEGAGVDAVSPGEVMTALKAGFRPEEIIYTSASATDEELRFAMEKKITVNADSVSQIERFGKLNPGGEISLRINPDVGAGHHDHVITGGPDSKFGIWIDHLKDAKAAADGHGLKIVGLHQHIGSGILEAEKFMQAAGVILEIAKNFGDLKFVDLGGGLGVPYSPEQKSLDLSDFGGRISEALAGFCSDYGRQIDFIFEPGRYLVAEAGALLCTVTAVKTTPKHRFAVVDTGFNHLIRPMAYGSYHPILNVNRVESGEKEDFLIAGNVCETGDVFTTDEQGPKDRKMPPVREGDVLAITVAGAYGYSMSSNYNLRPRPAEILVSKTKTSVIRKEESLNEMVERR